MEIGDLQPLQNLNQLTELNLQECMRLTGQSVFEFVWTQPTAIFIRSPFLIGTLGPISGLLQLTHLNLCYCRYLTGTVLVFGHNQLVISLADLQVHLNRWRGSANYRS